MDSGSGLTFQKRNSGCSMKWKEYFDRRRLYKKAWSDMKGEFDGESRRFLNKSHLVIQKIKKSKYCDTKRTDMGICSIRAVLNAG